MTPGQHRCADGYRSVNDAPHSQSLVADRKSSGSDPPTKAKKRSSIEAYGFRRVDFLCRGAAGCPFLGNGYIAMSSSENKKPGEH